MFEITTETPIGPPSFFDDGCREFDFAQRDPDDVQAHDEAVRERDGGRAVLLGESALQKPRPGPCAGRVSL